MSETAIHQGRNVRFFRQALNIKQSELVDILGPGWSQAKLSKTEQKQELDPDERKQIADALKISPDILESFDQTIGMTVIHNTFSDFKDNSINSIAHVFQPNIHPVDKVIELYERQLKEKDKLIQELLSKIPGK
jgi:transcriptional regulator with XRE-family HTH domain